MPLQIKLTDLSIPQGWILPDASPFNDGVMTALQAAQLAALAVGGTRYLWGPFTQSSQTLGGPGASGSYSFPVRISTTVAALFWIVVPFDGYVDGVSISFPFQNNTGGLGVNPSPLTIKLIDENLNDILAGVGDIVVPTNVASVNVDLLSPVAVSGGAAFRCDWSSAAAGTSVSAAMAVYWRMRAVP